MPCMFCLILNLALSESYLTTAWPATIMQFTSFQAYECSCIVALADFSFIVKPIETLTLNLLASLLTSLHRSSTPQRSSVLIRYILNE